MGLSLLERTLNNDNNPVTLNKFEMTSALRILKSNATIQYIGLYSKEDKRKVIKMLDDNLRKSDDIGIMLFYER